MICKRVKIFMFSILFLFLINNAHATRVLTIQQASKLTFTALTATPAQWKKWSHKTTFISKNNKYKRKYKIRLASYRDKFVKRNFHHHYRM